MSNNPLCEILRIFEENSGAVIKTLEEGENNRKNIKGAVAKYIYLIECYETDEKAPQCKEFQRKFNDFFGLSEIRGYTDDFKIPYYKLMQKYKDAGVNKGNNETLTLETVLNDLDDEYKEMGNVEQTDVERVFCSKLLSMLYPKIMPPWDSNVELVLDNWGILNILKTQIPPGTLRVSDRSEYIRAWSMFYTEVCELYNNFVASPVGENWLKQFRAWFDTNWYEWYDKEFFRLAEKEKEKEGWIKWLYQRRSNSPKEIMATSISDVKIIDLILWQMGGQMKKKKPKKN